MYLFLCIIVCICVFCCLMFTFVVFPFVALFLQYFDTVGWVFWPVKTVSHITYILFWQGRKTLLNPIQFILGHVTVCDLLSHSLFSSKQRHIQLTVMSSIHHQKITVCSRVKSKEWPVAVIGRHWSCRRDGIWQCECRTIYLLIWSQVT